MNNEHRNYLKIINLAAYVLKIWSFFATNIQLTIEII